MKFTEEHEWLKPEDDLIVVGITEHAATQLGDIVFVELPEVGTTVSKDDEIVEVNEALTDAPATINDDAMEGGWFFKIKPSDLSPMDDYMDEAAYKKMID